MKSKLLMETTLYKLLVRESKKKGLTPDELNEVLVRRFLGVKQQ